MNKKLIEIKENKKIEHLERLNEIKKNGGYKSVIDLQPFFNKN